MECLTCIVNHVLEKFHAHALVCEVTNYYQEHEFIIFIHRLSLKFNIGIVDKADSETILTIEQ